MNDKPRLTARLKASLLDAIILASHSLAMGEVQAARDKARSLVDLCADLLPADIARSLMDAHTAAEAHLVAHHLDKALRDIKLPSSDYLDYLKLPADLRQSGQAVAVYAEEAREQAARLRSEEHASGVASAASLPKRAGRTRKTVAETPCTCAAGDALEGHTKFCRRGQVIKVIRRRQRAGTL